MEKYFAARATTSTNSMEENILKTIFDMATGNNKNGAITIDVNGGKGAYRNKCPGITLLRYGCIERIRIVHLLKIAL